MLLGKVLSAVQAGSHNIHKIWLFCDIRLLFKTVLFVMHWDIFLIICKGNTTKF